jgi:hypothetical protein
VIRPLVQLLVCVVGFWLVAAGVANFLIPDQPNLLLSTTALLLCLPPGLATLAWSCQAKRKSADEQMLATLGGSGVRLFFVAGVGLALQNLAPAYQQVSVLFFWGWVLVFYLVIQFVELSLVLSATTPVADRRP